MTRVTVPKTFKLYIGGAFPRTESGRSTIIKNSKGDIVAHICRASRKDLRLAVESSSDAYPKWSQASNYLRGQILFRMAEMLESRREEFATAIQSTQQMTALIARKQVEASVDRLVTLAGWTDKLEQILGCSNPINGNYYNFTIPQSQGVVCVLAPQSPSLLALVTMIGTPLCAGNTVVVLGSSDNPLPAVIFSEICQTSDVPPGVINILTGFTKELLEHVATHREITSVYASGLSKQDRIILETGGADSLKRIRYIDIAEDEWADHDKTASPWNIEPFVEMKTIWHPTSC